MMKYLRRTLVLLALAGAFMGIVSDASAQVSCTGLPAFASCTAYANGASVTYNGSKYTSIAPIPNNRDCPPNSPYNPSNDNWWTNNGTCTGGATATRTNTATATARATATRTPTATPTTGRATATRTNTATATRTPTATATSGGGSCSGIPTWVPGTVDPADGNQFQYCSPARKFQAKNNPGPWETMPCTGDGGWFWTDMGLCGAGPTPTVTPTGATPTPTSGGGNIGTIITSAQFDQIWPPGQRSATYTYADFVTAANTYFPALCGTGDTNMKKRECAAYFASKDQETGVGQYDRELYCQPGGGGYGTAPCDYCQGSTSCGACASGQKYWGRHAVQLSWNYNYCSAQAGTGVSTLHADPNSIFNNKVTGWRASNWYWMTQLGPAVSNGYGTWPMESAHDAMTTTDASGNYGFGGTIRAVNGGIECQSRVQQQINRVTYYNGSGGENDEDGSGGTLGILGYAGSTYGRRYCSP